MRVMLIAFLAVALIAVVADYGLDSLDFSASERQSDPDTVRLD